jgi:hypothetical protein
MEEFPAKNRESGHIDLSILHISAKIYITLGVCEWNKVKCKAISNSLPIFISISNSNLQIVQNNILCDYMDEMLDMV